VTRDGLPLIGRVAGLDDAYIATGHSVWGILNAPATGEAMSELILDGTARNVDISPFVPKAGCGDAQRLSTIPTRLRGNRFGVALLAPRRRPVLYAAATARGRCERVGRPISKTNTASAGPLDCCYTDLRSSHMVRA